MSTKRKSIARGWIPPVSEARMRYLETGVLPSKDEGFWDAFIFSTPHTTTVQETWQAVRERMLEDWIERHPGTRPWAWWKFDAPDWQGPIPPSWAGAFWTTGLKEPRRRLGGVGTPAHEALNHVPHWHCGLPASGWVSEWDTQYYTGRGVDAFGKRIGQEFVGRAFPYQAFDPNDPPIYESQAAYLDRHGLLTDDERRRLPAAAFEPERVRCDEGDEGDDDGDK